MLLYCKYLDLPLVSAGLHVLVSQTADRVSSCSVLLASVGFSCGVATKRAEVPGYGHLSDGGKQPSS